MQEDNARTIDDQVVPDEEAKLSLIHISAKPDRKTKGQEVRIYDPGTTWAR